MSNEKITSREYKLVLAIEKFAGDEKEMLNKADIFWQALQKTALQVIKAADGNFDAIRPAREIRFYDTEDSLLNSKKYIFRERICPADNTRELTLKFRHHDRYISQDRDMRPGINGKVKIKFEEDIKAPFEKLHSFSGSVEKFSQRKIENINDVIKIFPGLDSSLRKDAGDKSIHLVNGFAAKEIVITGATLRLSNNPVVNAECAIITWYDMPKNKIDPVIAEFSFRYENKNEKYKRKTAQRAYDLFHLIQDEMKEWIDATGNTKTGFVYNG